MSILKEVLHAKFCVMNLFKVGIPSGLKVRNTDVTHMHVHVSTDVCVSLDAIGRKIRFYSLLQQICFEVPC